jgi:hypothetical protein
MGVNASRLKAIRKTAEVSKASDKRCPLNPSPAILHNEIALLTHQFKNDRVCSNCQALLPGLLKVANTRSFADIDLGDEDHSNQVRFLRSRYNTLNCGIKIGIWPHRGFDLDTNECTLCEMFLECRLTDCSTEIRAFSLLHMLLAAKDFLGLAARGREFVDWATKEPFDSPIIAVVPADFTVGTYSNQIDSETVRSRYLMCHEVSSSAVPPLFSPYKILPKFDTQVAKKWIEYCRVKHATCADIGEGHWLQAIALIDISSGAIHSDVGYSYISKTGNGYAALSYVWGDTQPSTREARGKRLPNILPKVIQDAVLLTKKLGLKYLWVDKYCIDQSNEAEMHNQIQQMDLIFRNAEVTIIAAAGIDQNHGLAGVSVERDPKRQSSVCVGNVQITSMLPPMQEVIRGSCWARRGWTYQEAFLSRRRLIFTEREVFFECDGMSCRESMVMLLDKAHEIDGSGKALPFLPPGIFGLAQLKAEMWNRRTSWVSGVMLERERAWLMLTSCIKEYATRELTFSGDSINAFAGILRQFESSVDTPVRHVYGIPYLLHNRESAKKSDSSGPQDLFAAGLCWYHTHDTNTHVAGRREGFPSWSWSGWSGSIEGFEDPVEFERIARTIRLEDDSGSLISLADVVDKQSHISYLEQPTIVSMKTFTVPGRQWGIPINDGPESPAVNASPGQLPIKVATYTGTLTLDNAGLDQKLVIEMKQKELCDLIVIGSTNIPQSSSKDTILLLIQWENAEYPINKAGVAKRIGYARVRHLWNQRLPLSDWMRDPVRLG